MSKNQRLKIGVQFQTHNVAPVAYEGFVRQALILGVDSVFFWDHLVPFTGSEGDVAWETWALMGSLAHLFRDSEAILGVLVSPLSIREPAVLARSAATVAQLGNGKVILGVGAGGFEHDDNLTDAPKDKSSRMNLFKRRLTVLRSEVERLNSLLGTAISIWVGGGGENVTIPVAISFADGWNGFGPSTDFEKKVAKLLGSDLELSVLLTPAMTENRLDEYYSLGSRHVIRSLRPNPEHSFDLSLIVQMLSERDQIMGSL